MPSDLNMELYWYIVVIIFIVIKIFFYVCWYRSRQRQLAAYLNNPRNSQIVIVGGRAYLHQMCERQNTSIWPSWYGVQDEGSVGESSASLPPAAVSFSHLDMPPPYQAVSGGDQSKKSKPGSPNQGVQTKESEPRSPNQGDRTKESEPRSPNQGVRTKESQTKESEPRRPNQGVQTKESKPRKAKPRSPNQGDRTKESRPRSPNQGNVYFFCFLILTFSCFRL
uniref:Si:dkey-118j18.2 n=1 Tax=Oncorhynchus mykiss TaxID=8022 RepID=A0A8K9Y169_ONCMY